ncbi:MAG: hypothetical protein NXY57DRAFT_892665, partial [Lentinula lateritia]
WFGQAFEFLNEDLGPKYTELIGLWMRFEEVHQWKSSRDKLSDLCQPAMLNDWSRRRTSKVPALSTVTLVQRFSESVWRWWCSLQPPWRHCSVNNRPGPLFTFGIEWQSLNKSGRNGWMLLITCLKWWREGLDSLSEEDKQELEIDWYLAVDDIFRMLQGLVRHLTK